MRVLVCGSRDWTDWDAIRDRLAKLPIGCVVITGAARGADGMAEDVAIARGLFVASVPCLTAHWNRYGKSAGHKRNAAMLALAPDLVIAFSTGSNGTQGTIDCARALGIPVEVFGREKAKGAA